MENPRPEKVAVVEEVRERLESTDAVVITEYRGLDVPALADLRKSLREAGGEYKIYKNTLVRLAARDLDLEIEELLSGPTALAFTGTKPDGSAGDPVTVAKALRDFGKDHEQLVIKGGLLGDEHLDSAQILKLASIAPREELLSQFAGLLAAPLQQLAGLLAALPTNFAYALQALIEKSGGLEAADAASEEAEAAPTEEADSSADDEEASAEGSDEPAEGSDEPADGEEETADASEEADSSADGGEDSSEGETDDDAAASTAEAGNETAEGSDEPADGEADSSEGETDDDAAASTAEAGNETAEASDESDETDDDPAASTAEAGNESE